MPYILLKLSLKCQITCAPLGHDLRKRELSTQTPQSIRKVLVTCPQHKTTKFEVRQIPSSEIGKNLHVF